MWCWAAETASCLRNCHLEHGLAATKTRFWAGSGCGRKIRWRILFELAYSRRCVVEGSANRIERYNFQSFPSACILHAHIEEAFHGAVVTAEIFSYVACEQFCRGGRQSFWACASGE